jgi:hypothetical protein
MGLDIKTYWLTVSRNVTLTLIESSVESQNSSSRKMSLSDGDLRNVASCIKAQQIRSATSKPVLLVTQTPDTWRYISHTHTWFLTLLSQNRTELKRTKMVKISASHKEVRMRLHSDSMNIKIEQFSEFPRKLGSAFDSLKTRVRPWNPYN